MAVIQSFGALEAHADPPYSDAMYRANAAMDTSNAWTYADLYRTQPNVRTVIDFLARNIAQLSLHAFRRISDDDRERLADHELIQWIEEPNPFMTSYRLFESVMQDLGIYFNAYWLKLRLSDRIGLVRLPPQDVTVQGWLLPSAYIWTTPDGVPHAILPEDIVYFGGYDPCDPIMGLSPLETLRQILAEDAAASSYRKSYWMNASRIEGVVERPQTAPKWTPLQKQAWREQWQQRFGGPGNAGQVAVLEDGMTFKATSFSARDSEYVPARKLTQEEVARAYHVPLPMVGILDHATFSNIKEQHKQLYSDCLGPWLKMIQLELKRQLLIECADQDRIYLEFNIAEKLKGSFEEQAASLQTLVGRPVMTLNEGRARLNLSGITDDPTANQVALPLNTSTGGAAAALPPAIVETKEAA